jgi:DNA-binding NarL/FixJ family response regulator
MSQITQLVIDIVLDQPMLQDTIQQIAAEGVDARLSAMQRQCLKNAFDVLHRCMPGLILLTDVKGRVVHWAVEFRAIARPEIEIVRGISIHECFAGDERFSVTQLIEEALSGASTDHSRSAIQFDALRVRCEKVFIGQAQLLVWNKLLDINGTTVTEKWIRRRHKAHNLLSALSPRQREVAQMVADGEPNKTIAAQLGISIKTVEMHRSNAMKRLHLTRTADLIRLIVEAAPLE